MSQKKMFFGTGSYFPKLSSNGKNMSDQDAGEISAQSNLHPTHKSWEVEAGWGRPTKSRFQRVGPFWALSSQSSARRQTAPLEACPPQVPTWIEKNYERPANPHIPVPPSMQHPSPFLSAAQCPPCIYFGTPWGPTSSCALQISADNTQLAPHTMDSRLPYSPIQATTRPSVLLHITLKCGSSPLAPTHASLWHPRFSGADNLSVPDWTSNLSCLFQGWCLWGTSKYKMAHQECRCYGGEPRGTPYCSSSDADPLPHHTHMLMHILNQLLQRGSAWWSASRWEWRNSWGLILLRCEFPQLPRVVHPSVSTSVKWTQLQRPDFALP